MFYNGANNHVVYPLFTGEVNTMGTDVPSCPIANVTLNHGVESSSPSALTIKINNFAQNRRFPPTPCVATVLADRLPPSPLRANGE
jgi:hypothetical protein